MSSFYIENLYNIIHTENITIIYTYAKNLPKSHEFEAVEGKNGYTQRFYQQSLDARACARYAFSEYNITRSEIPSDIYGKTCLAGRSNRQVYRIAKDVWEQL